MTWGKEKDVIIFIHVWMVSYVNVGNANDKRQDVRIRICVHSNRVF